VNIRLFINGDFQRVVHRWPLALSFIALNSKGRRVEISRGSYATTATIHIIDRHPPESSEPVCRRCEKPGSECGCEPNGDFA
jgi:hypothetical protein